MTSALQHAREAFATQAWGQAIASYAAADQLECADHEKLAIAAYLTGADDQCESAWEAAQHAALEDGDQAEAARFTFWLALCLMLRGQSAQAGGWFSRSQSLVAEAGGDCAASGYLLIPPLLEALHGGDPDSASSLATQALEVAKRHDDPDLSAFAVLGDGQALIARGDIATGTARFDEVMVSVVAGEVGPIASGIVYCAVILECMALFDLRRASEWTDALSAWCDTQPDLVPYRGQCLVHRSQLQTASGQWSEAVTAAEAACRRLTDPPHPALGLAYYQEGELHRLLGRLEEAEAAYRHASRHGHDPVPGLALLEMARGDVGAGVTMIRRAMHETRSPALLAAAVDLLRAAGDVVGARAAADELTEVATGAAPVLEAMAAYARGSVLVAEGDPVAALAELRTSARVWQTLHMPYEGARTAVLLGLACSALGDQTAAYLEFANARATFIELGAAPDLDRLDALTGARGETSSSADLSPRETEVLAHLASGKTNREIAAALHISHHTVGRHVENLFTKLGVTSRAAATARAYEMGLISR